MDFSASAENYTAVRYIEPGWFDHGSLLPGCVSNADRRSSRCVSIGGVNRQTLGTTKCA